MVAHQFYIEIGFRQAGLIHNRKSLALKICGYFACRCVCYSLVDTGGNISIPPSPLCIQKFRLL